MGRRRGGGGGAGPCAGGRWWRWPAAPPAPPPCSPRPPGAPSAVARKRSRMGRLGCWVDCGQSAHSKRGGGEGGPLQAKVEEAGVLDAKCRPGKKEGIGRGGGGGVPASGRRGPVQGEALAAGRPAGQRDRGHAGSRSNPDGSGVGGNRTTGANGGLDGRLGGGVDTSSLASKRPSRPVALPKAPPSPSQPVTPPIGHFGAAAWAGGISSPAGPRSSPAGWLPPGAAARRGGVPGGGVRRERDEATRADGRATVVNFLLNSGEVFGRLMNTCCSQDVFHLGGPGVRRNRGDPAA